MSVARSPGLHGPEPLRTSLQKADGRPLPLDTQLACGKNRSVVWQLPAGSERALANPEGESSAAWTAARRLGLICLAITSFLTWGAGWGYAQMGPEIVRPPAEVPSHTSPLSTQDQQEVMETPAKSSSSQTEIEQIVERYLKGRESGKKEEKTKSG